MSAALAVVLPIFAVILVGFACGRRRLLGPTACSELNRFVVYLGLPALLFSAMAQADWAALWQPGFIASFAGGSFAVFAATLVWRRARGRHLTDASIDGLNAGYANAGYIGFPLCQLVFGQASLTLVTVATLLTACGLFASAIVFVEIGLQTERRAGRLAAKVGRSLLRNPLLIAPVLGMLWSATGLALPGSLRSFLGLLAAAASPCALVSLGLFLAQSRGSAASARRPALALAGMKLIAQPALTAICAYGVFRIAALPAAVAVLLAALPTGTGSFMIAEFYGREARVTSGAILLSTLASIVTLTACIALLRGVSP